MVAVKVFVTDPISKRVWASSGREAPELPDRSTLTRPPSMMPTTIAVPGVTATRWSRTRCKAGPRSEVRSSELTVEEFAIIEPVVRTNETANAVKIETRTFFILRLDQHG